MSLNLRELRERHLDRKVQRVAAAWNHPFGMPPTGYLIVREAPGS